ncbi:large ribosomal subunit protein mL49 [Anabrus simplex]|uniref:large ribosomal subunit protein mL49 n=1 Tax=Anabrus simplex TaxID=316456 RepID=UPI0035A39FFB
MAAYKIAVNAVKCLIPSKLCYPAIINPVCCTVISGNTAANNSIIPFRSSSYRSSPIEGPPEQYTGYEISNSPEEWKFVERLLPLKVVPEPVPKSEYPSGWKPPSDECLRYPYYIERSKNHMLPVYLDLSYRGMRKITKLKRIHGDIWALEKELKDYLEEKNQKIVTSQVHEQCGHIFFKGDHVHYCQEWLLSKGF